MYAVVTLKESNEVMVAAFKWLIPNMTQCRWPPFRSAEKFTEAVKNRVEPSKGWEMLNIRCHGEYATFEQALTAKDEIKGKKEIERPVGIIKRPRLENQMSKYQFNPPLEPSTSTPPTDDKDEILQMLREIKSKVHENSTMLKKIVKDTAVSDQAPSSTSTHSMDDKPNLNLPLKTFEDMQRTELELNNAAMRMRYVKCLSDLGGFGHKDVIKNIMQHVLTDDLAKEFNWKGRGEKRPFSRLALANIIKEAAFKRHITEDLCEIEIKNYLRYTADRIGRKRQRDAGSGLDILTFQPTLDNSSWPQFESPFII